MRRNAQFFHTRTFNFQSKCNEMEGAKEEKGEENKKRQIFPDI